MLSRRSEMKSLKHLHKPKEEDGDDEEPKKVRRSASQHSRLKPIDKTSTDNKNQDSSKKKSTLLAERKKGEIELKTNRIIDAKLNTVKLHNIKESPVKKVQPSRFSKPTNYHQAAEQLINKL